MVWTVLKEGPRALGTVQIIIGAVVLFFGIVLKAVNINVNSANSYVMYWGSISFISSGALGITSLTHRNSYVVNASLAMNVISVVTASVAASKYNTDLLKSPESMCSDIFYQRELALVYCTFLWKHIIRNSRVLQGFSIFEAFVSFATVLLTWITRRST